MKSYLWPQLVEETNSTNYDGVNERFHENETGYLVTHLDRVLYIPRASSLLKDVRAQNVPTYRFFLKLPTQKGDDLLSPQIRKKRG